MKKKDVSTINDSVYNKLDENVGTIIDSIKQVDARNDPIKETHIVDGIITLSIGVGSLEPAVIGIRIIGQGSSQINTNLVTNIGTNLVTNVLKKSNEHFFNTNSSRLNTFQSEAFVIGLQDESVEGSRNIICTSRDSRNIRGNHISRIDTPGVNKDIWSVIDTTSKVLSCTDNVDKFYTIVHSSTTQERNMELLRIKEVGVKIIFSELRKKPNPSVRVNLADSVLSEIPRFITPGQPTVETADIQNVNFVTSTRAKNLNGLQKGTGMDDNLGKTHDFETIRKTTDYRNHIKNLEIETREVFDRETWRPENIQLSGWR